MKSISSVLGRGQSGEDVRALQVLLAANGYRVTASGLYDAATEAAVSSAQRAHNLPADGRFTPALGSLLPAPSPAPLALSRWGTLQ